MSFTTISATTLGLADGDQSPTPVSGTVRITPRHPAGTIDSGGVIATGPVIVTVTGGAFPSTAVPAREDSTALVEFHLYTTDGPVRMPDTEIPLAPGATINLRDHLPAGVDPATGWGLARGDDGAGITDITAQNGQITILWEGGGSRTIDVPDAVQGVGVQDATQPTAGKLALTLTDGSTTSQVTLPDGPQGRDGSNVLPTGVAIAQAIGPEGVARGALDTAIGQLAVTSPSVGRIVTSTDPAEPLSEGEVLLVYQGQRRMFEQFDDGLIGLTPRWKDRGGWQADAGNIVLPSLPGVSTTRRRAVSFDQVGEHERDVDVLWQFIRDGTFSAMHSGVVFRGRAEANGSETGITVGLSSNNLVVWTFDAGAAVNVASVPVTVPTGVPHRGRAGIDGDRLYARVWSAAEVEPATWQIDRTLTTIPRPGWVGLASSTANDSITQTWLWASVGTQGQTAVIP